MPKIAENVVLTEYTPKATWPEDIEIRIGEQPVLSRLGLRTTHYFEARSYEGGECRCVRGEGRTYEEAEAYAWKQWIEL